MNENQRPNPNQPPPPAQQGGGGYGGGYGYGGYYYGSGGYGGYGGGGGGGGEGQPNRTLKDYLIILRERIWYFVVVFFIIFTGSILYTVQAERQYTASARIEILRQKFDAVPDMIRDGRIEQGEIRSTEDFNTHVSKMKSMTITQNVANQLTDEDEKELMRYYQDMINLTGALSIEEVLIQNVRIQPERMTYIINILYTHPNPAIAAEIANAYADQYILFLQSQNTNNIMTAAAELERRIDEKEKEIVELEEKMTSLEEAVGSTLNRDNRSDEISLQELKSAENSALLEFNRVETRWNQAQEALEAGRPLFELPFIADDGLVQNMLADRSATMVDVETLRKRYKPLHPRMAEALRTLEQTESELERTVQSAYRRLETNFNEAKQNLKLARQQRAEKESMLISRSRKQTEYEQIMRRRDIEKEAQRALSIAHQEQISKMGLETKQATVIDTAVPPRNPSKPNVLMNLALGLFGGGACGVGLVFVIAFLDDRVKSAYDIETNIGLPLVGVVPRIRKLNSPDKAKAIANNSDRRVTEAFRSIHSSLRLNELSRSARTFLMTSTVPSEGKSFVTTNLALTYAMHGEKVIVLDCDLRMPNVGKSLGLEEKDGVIQFLEGKLDIDQATRKEIYPNVDAMLAGGKSQNPTALLASKRFEELLAELQERYDRIFIDSPPIAAVSDAINTMSHVDGVLYVVKFNAVKRKTIRANIRRLVDANVPVFGAVLNQINASAASYYYTNYYDKSYSNYYSAAPVIAAQPEAEQKQEPKDPEVSGQA